MKQFAVCIFSIFLALLAVQPAMAQKRVALVIGNSAYEHTATLPNPQNDAKALTATLKRLGFEVLGGTDLNRRKFEQSVVRFSRKLHTADVGLFFYAGHGLQVSGQNYLVPIDAELKDEADLQFAMIKLDDVLAQMERSTKTNLIFIDACRDNPLARSLARAMGRTRSGSIGRGLAPVRTGIGSMITFATEPGNVAQDGKGKNSPFTTALLKHIETPGLDIAPLLRSVRRDVIKATRRTQVPWNHSSLTDSFYFKEGQKIKRNRFTPGTIFDHCNGAGWCPSMVVVPKGSFMMGSKKGHKDEKPVHRVTIPRAFAVGQFEITVKEYQRCVDEYVCKPPKWQKNGDKYIVGDRFPIHGVDWKQAKTYLNWLSSKTHEAYRLLSEAEWEYVARGNKGSQNYWWGSKASHEYANYGKDECCGELKKGKDKWKYASPIGSFPENPFKVYDMHGNVWEWVEDCFENSYKGVPTNGDPHHIRSCKRRVLRGGSWLMAPRFLRSASRRAKPKGSRDAYYGFRVARSLPLARTR